MLVPNILLGRLQTSFVYGQHSHEAFFDVHHTYYKSTLSAGRGRHKHPNQHPPVRPRLATIPTVVTSFVSPMCRFPLESSSSPPLLSNTRFCIIPHQPDVRHASRALYYFDPQVSAPWLLKNNLEPEEMMRTLLGRRPNGFSTLFTDNESDRSAND
jgi:hypothetical protein